MVIGGYLLFKPKPPEAPDTVADLAEAEAYVEALIEYGTPPGISILVVKDVTTGMVSTATDHARFMVAYLNDGELDGSRILSAETVHLMTYNPPVANAPSGETRPFSGLGWGVFPEGGGFYLDHGGGGSGFGADMRIYPEESLAMVVVANDTTHNPEAVLDLFASPDW